MLLFFSLIILGLIFGSFGSVILFRLGALPNGETLKKFFIGRSECRNCHHTLGIQDLIPLRSFFSQKGKCRYCQAKLSRRYPILEI
ncbi:MAG: prepilin peptidase [Candidatus Peribacteria bacterium]|nr:prepilin peptidase [Candidatus Peribacteria bacterium]